MVLVEGDRLDQEVRERLAMTLHLLISLLLPALEDDDFRALRCSHDLDDDLCLARGDRLSAVLSFLHRPKSVESEFLTGLSFDFLDRDLLARNHPELPTACFDDSVHRGLMISNPTEKCKPERCRPGRK